MNRLVDGVLGQQRPEAGDCVVEADGLCGRSCAKLRVKGLPEAVERAVQVVGPGDGVGLGPQRLDRLVLQQAALQSQELQKRGGLAPAPG